MYTYIYIEEEQARNLKPALVVVSGGRAELAQPQIIAHNVSINWFYKVNSPLKNVNLLI